MNQPAASGRPLTSASGVTNPNPNRESSGIGTTVEYQKRVGGRLIRRFVVAPIHVATIDRLLHETGGPSESHGNSRPVVICGEIDAGLYAERVENRGALPITECYFESARAASTHLGYKWDAVGQALNRAKRRNEDMAYVCGVPFKWADEMLGVD